MKVNAEQREKFDEKNIKIDNFIKEVDNEIEIFTTASSCERPVEGDCWGGSDAVAGLLKNVQNYEHKSLGIGANFFSFWK